MRGSHRPVLLCLVAVERDFGLVPGPVVDREGAVQTWQGRGWEGRGWDSGGPGVACRALLRLRELPRVT